jgi:hypothetical protein
VSYWLFPSVIEPMRSGMSSSNSKSSWRQEIVCRNRKLTPAGDRRRRPILLGARGQPNLADGRDQDPRHARGLGKDSRVRRRAVSLCNKGQNLKKRQSSNRPDEQSAIAGRLPRCKLPPRRFAPG